MYKNIKVRTKAILSKLLLSLEAGFLEHEGGYDLVMGRLPRKCVRWLWDKRIAWTGKECNVHPITLAFGGLYRVLGFDRVQPFGNRWAIGKEATAMGCID